MLGGGGAGATGAAVETGFGGAAAIGTTLLLDGPETDGALLLALVVVVLVVGREGWEGVVDGTLLLLPVPLLLLMLVLVLLLLLLGAAEVEATGGCWVEFFREIFLPALTALTVTLLLPPRLRFLITSVFNDKGRTTPCNLRKSPQALHRGWPSGLRRHNGVVRVKQFVQVWLAALPDWSPPFEFPGLAGREGALLLKLES